MRSSHHDRLLMIESHVYIRACTASTGLSHHRCRPSALPPPNTRYRRTATAPPSRRACCSAARRVHRLPVHRINHNLRIKLSGRPSHQWMRRSPRHSIVIADHQRDRGSRTGRAIADRAVPRKENVEVSTAIRRQSRLPLIPSVIANTVCGSEARCGHRRRRHCQREIKEKWQVSALPGCGWIWKPKELLLGHRPLQPCRTL